MNAEEARKIEEETGRRGPFVQVFGIFDVKVGAFLPPFYARSKQEGARTFWDLVADPQNVFHKHPNDYRLFHLGEMDLSTGRYEAQANGPALWEEGSAVAAEMQRQVK